MLAARGDAEAVRVYSQWLSGVVHMLVPFPRRVSPAALRQPAIHEAARTAALAAWREAARGELGVTPLGALLLCLWPAWRDEQEVSGGAGGVGHGGGPGEGGCRAVSWMEGELPPR